MVNIAPPADASAQLGTFGKFRGRSDGQWHGVPAVAHCDVPGLVKARQSSKLASARAAPELGPIFVGSWQWEWAIGHGVRKELPEQNSSARSGGTTNVLGILGHDAQARPYPPPGMRRVPKWPGNGAGQYSRRPRQHLFLGGVSQLSGGPPENGAASPSGHDGSRLPCQLQPLPSRTSDQGFGLGCIRHAPACGGDDVPRVSRNCSSGRRAPDCRCCEICT